MGKKILVVESSAVIRRYIVTLLQKEGYELYSAKNLDDVKRYTHERFALALVDITMDDALVIVQTLIQHATLRVMILSTEGMDEKTMEALELGALDAIKKPQKSVDIATVAPELVKKVRDSFVIFIQKRGTDELCFKEHNHIIDTNIEMGFVLIGASTGGPRLIEKICRSLPKGYPHAVCVVQHMPTDFTANFARRLNSISEVEVLEATNGMALKKGRVIIAKGGMHLHIRKRLKDYVALLAPNVQERFFVPSVDELFFSASEVLPVQKILAVELTGIGDDGADGMVALHNKGAYTLAESEESAVVYGMPKEAALRGGATKVLSFNQILDEIIKYGQSNDVTRT